MLLRRLRPTYNSASLFVMHQTLSLSQSLPLPHPTRHTPIQQCLPTFDWQLLNNKDLTWQGYFDLSYAIPACHGLSMQTNHLETDQSLPALAPRASGQYQRSPPPVDLIGDRQRNRGVGASTRSRSSHRSRAGCWYVHNPTSFFSSQLTQPSQDMPH